MELELELELELEDSLSGQNHFHQDSADTATLLEQLDQ